MRVWTSAWMFLLRLILRSPSVSNLGDVQGEGNHRRSEPDSQQRAMTSVQMHGRECLSSNVTSLRHFACECVRVSAGHGQLTAAGHTPSHRNMSYPENGDRGKRSHASWHSESNGL